MNPPVGKFAFRGWTLPNVQILDKELLTKKFAPANQPEQVFYIRLEKKKST
jgi:hypothetical protein